MSNTSDTKPYIKISDSFDVPIQMIDTSTGEAVEITSGMMFSSKIVNLQGEVIATTSVVPYLDQIADKGYILLSVPTSVTAASIIGALGYTPASTRKTVNNQSVSYTLQLTDASNVIRTTGAGATNITVPNSTTVAFTPQDRVEIEYYGTGQPTIVAASGVTIRVAGGGSLALTQQYSRVLLEYVGSNEWVMYR